MLAFFQSVLTLVLPVLGTAGAGLIVWILKKKFNLQITAEQEHLLAGILHNAIRFAEEGARKKTKGLETTPLSGAEKLKLATDYTRKEVARVGIKLSDDQINDMLHAALGGQR